MSRQETGKKQGQEETDKGEIGERTGGSHLHGQSFCHFSLWKVL